MISIEQVGSLAQVDASQWDELAGPSVIAGYGWLRTLEETGLSTEFPRYFLARSGARLVGAVACSVEQETDSSRLNRVLFGRLVKAAQYLRLSVVPCLMCGAEVGAAEPVLVRAGATAEERQRITAALVGAIEETGREKGWAICFRQVRRARSPIAEVLTNHGYLRGSELPTACLELDPGWRSFADFRRHLKKLHPQTAKSIRGELSRAKRAGLVIDQLEEPAPYRERLHRLMDAHFVRLGGKPFPFRAEFFDQLKLRLGDRAGIYIARIGAELVGALVVLCGGDEVMLPMIGINPDSGRKAAAYFNLGYNRPIEDSIAAGHRRIYFGRLVYDAKARRGCAGVESDFYLRVWRGFQERTLRALWPLRSWRNDRLSAALRGRKQKRDHEVTSLKA